MADYEAFVGLDGYSSALEIYIPAAFPTLPSDGLGWCGAIFDLGLTLATGRTDLVLSPPTLTELTFSSTVDVLLGAIARTYSVYIVNTPAVPNFVSGEFSPTRYVANGTAVLVQEVNYIAALPAGFTFNTSIPMSTLYPIYRGSGWVGRFGIVFRLAEDAAPANVNALRSSLHGTTPEVIDTGTELSFMLGRSGNVKARSRVDRCPICGFYDVREKFVPDGYRSGLLVCSKCWDPEDPPSKPIPPDAPPIND